MISHTPSHHQDIGCQAKTYIHQLCAGNGCLLEDWVFIARLTLRASMAQGFFLGGAF